jgi:prevent-host-death family protein
MQVSVAEAKNRLPELLKAVEEGEQITITRRGVPIVELVRAKKPAKKNVKLGTMRDRIVIHDPDWWKPMTDEEVEKFLETGKY